MSPKQPRSGRKNNQASTESPEQLFGAGELRAHVPAEIRNVSFPSSVRGYDREAVDAYVLQVNRVVAELEVSRSPQAAVRHAVERVTEQTRVLLQQAHESAERITDNAREEAAEIVATAKSEAAELVVGASTEAERLTGEAEQVVARAQAEAERIIADAQAEAAEHRRRSEEEIAALREQAAARLREVEADTEAVRAEGRDLLGGMHDMANQLEQVASAAAGRFSTEDGAPTGARAAAEAADLHETPEASS